MSDVVAVVILTLVVVLALLAIVAQRSTKSPPPAPQQQAATTYHPPAAEPTKPDATPRKGRFIESLWPTISDPTSARKAARTGAAAAFWVAGVTTVAVLLAVSNVLKYPGMDAWAMLDASLFAGLGVMILRMSRVAAVLALVAFVAERVYWLFTVGPQGAVGVVAFFFLMAFISGVRGTVRYRQFLKQEPISTPRPIN